MWQILAIAGSTFGTILVVAMLIAAVEQVQRSRRARRMRRAYRNAAAHSVEGPPSESAIAASMTADTLSRASRTSADAASRRGQGPSWAETQPMVVNGDAAEGESSPSPPAAPGRHTAIDLLLG